MNDAYDTGRFADVPERDLAAVRSAADAAGIVGRMLADLRAHPDAWENATLERFLDALADSLDAVGPDSVDPSAAAPDPADPDQADPNSVGPGERPPSWRLVAELLVKASGYE